MAPLCTQNTKLKHVQPDGVYEQLGNMTFNDLDGLIIDVQCKEPLHKRGVLWQCGKCLWQLMLLQCLCWTLLKIFQAFVLPFHACSVRLAGICCAALCAAEGHPGSRLCSADVRLQP